MKKLFVFSLVFIFYLNAFSQVVNDISVSPDIQNITVFLEGAEVSRHVEVNLKPGQNKIKFTGLSPQMDPSTIRVFSDINVSILAISHKIDYLYKKEEQPRIKAIKDSIQLLDNKINALRSEKDAYNTEKSLLMKNQAMGGDNTGVEIEELIKAADFYRVRILEINRKLEKINISETKLSVTRNKLNKELIERNGKSLYLRSEVTVLLGSKNTAKYPVDIVYLVNQAGWSPLYDLRATEVGKPIELIYRANVYNNTSIDWQKTKLTLSTGDPSLSATQPSLRPWYMNYSKSYRTYKKQLQVNQSKENNAPAYVNSEGLLNNAGTLGEFAQTQVKQGYIANIQVNQMSAIFKVEEPYTIPADDKPYIVELTEYELPASYQHFAVPKLDRDAFLLARITGWEDLDLVAGPVSIFFDGVFIGKSFLETRQVSDTLDLSLGRDKRVLVTRTKQKDFTSKRKIGSKTKETRAYEIIVKNNSKVAVTIEVQDQVPVSMDNDIEVGIDNISGANYNEVTGEVSWKLTLQPGESQKMQLKFWIKYPNSKPVTTHGRQMKSQSVRYF